MHIFYRNFLFITILSVFIMANSGCRESSSGIHAINISGEWKIINEDNLNIAKYDYDDSNASVLNLPGNWMNILQNNESMASILWLRKSVYIDDSFSGSELVLALGNIGVADEVYFNGCFIGVTGGMPKGEKALDYRFAWKTPRYYLIPKFLIKFNHANTISVRVFSHVINGVTGNLQICEIWNEYPYKLRDSIPVMMNYFAIIINMFFFFLFLVQYIYDRSRLIFLYLALIAISGIILNIYIVDIPFYINGMTRFKTIFIVYSSISFFLALFMQELFNRKKIHIITLLLSLLYCLSIFSILLTRTTRVLCMYTRVEVMLFTFACQLFAFTGLIVLMLKNLRKYWLFIFGIPIVLSTILNDYYVWNMNYDAIYTRIFLHVPLLITIFLFFIIFDYESEKHSNETIFQSLKKKAQRLQNELSKVKGTNVKPQPNERIYDLIDYIDINFTKTYNRVELAKHFGINENYMLQIFKKITGKTISNYINAKRIEKAIGMLDDKNIKIIDIAYNIGFENYNHFFRLFKETTGMSPDQFRKSLIEK